jgi:predicted small secreted protein
MITMKKIAFTFAAAAIILSGCNQSQSHNTTAGTNSAVAASGNATDAPVMKFEKDNFDFGKIKQGDKVSYAFKFINTGKSPLIITDAVATCGCTKPEAPKGPVSPGQSGEIKVTFNSAGKEGLMDKQITVTANTIPAQSRLHLVGEVLKSK